MPTGLDQLIDRAFDDRPGNPLATTHAVLVMQHGEIVAERYSADFDASSTFISWSMAKSMTSALTGVLVDRGLIDIETPAPVPEWRQGDDPRGAITWRHLLEMRSGLAWNEDYVDDQVSDVIDMLFGDGKHDCAAHAAAKPLAHEPGEHWYYSSGTTNILSRCLGAVLGGHEAMAVALRDDLFGPAGMPGAIPKFDDAGTFIGSSFVYVTAREFAAFGELYRRGGVADGVRVVSEEWVARSLVDHATCPDTGQGYGFQWWMVRDEHGSYCCNGYEGQRIEVVPTLGLTLVRLGKTDAAYADDLRAFYAEVVDSFA